MFTSYIIECLEELGCSGIKSNPGRDYVTCNCPGGHDVATPSFSIRKYDLLYNCFGCPIQGNAYRFIVDLCGRPREEWRKVNWEIDSGAYQSFNTLKEKSPTVLESEKYVDVRRAAEWIKTEHSYMTAVRGFDAKFLKEHKVGFDTDNNSVAFIIYDGAGTLRGVVYKNLSIGSYLFYGFDTEEFLYGESFENDFSKPAILVEGCIDNLRLRSFGFINVFSCWRSSGFSARHMQYLKKFPETVLMLDKDKAGASGIEKIIKRMITSSKLSYAWEYPLTLEKPDPGNLDEDSAWQMFFSRKDALYFTNPFILIDTKLPGW